MPGPRHCVMVIATLALAACAMPTGPAVEALRFSAPVVLLGEVHDHPGQHALRLQAFEAALARGARPALALEQFDRDRQGAIDALRAREPAPDPQALISAVGGSGWDWDFYRPFIALALQHGLPIVAANVPRDEARRVMREGLAAAGFEARVPADVLAAHTRSIETSHCGALPPGLAPQMALAQVARDQFMARVLQEQAARGVVLLAGNGHVRTDVGVPRWLDPATRARSVAIGVLEAGDTTTAFDRIVRTAAHPRPDPCVGFKPPAAR